MLVMSPREVAAIAVRIMPIYSIHTPQGPASLAAIMTAIAGAESSYEPTNSAPGPAPICGGKAFIGLLQISLNHAAINRAYVGSNDPCKVAAWLENPENNMKAARYLLGPRGEGLSNWGTWTSGAYLRFLPAAVVAVSQVSHPVSVVSWLSKNKAAALATAGAAGAVAGGILLLS